MSKDKQKEAVAQEAARRAEIQKIQEERINAIINLVRDKLYPALKDEGRTINEIKVVCESLAVTINQGLYLIMKEKTVGDLDLQSKISDKFTERDLWLKLIELINEVPLDTAIESLQWIGQKIQAVINEENQKRPFNDLDFKLGTSDAADKS